MAGEQASGMWFTLGTRGLGLRYRGVGRNISRGWGEVIVNVVLQKDSNCTDLFPNTLYWKCIKFGGGGGRCPLQPSVLRHYLGHVDFMFSHFRLRWVASANGSTRLVTFHMALRKYELTRLTLKPCEHLRMGTKCRVKPLINFE